MNEQDIPAEILERLKAVTKKRPKAVIKHILEYGFISTEELTSKYGYEHPPRAARDVREEGIPLETFRVKNSHGRSIGAYRFGDFSLIRLDRVGGRATFSKNFKKQLAEKNGQRCAICSALYEERYLQVDHRVPYEVEGDNSLGNGKPEDYMLVCAPCNCAKSWSCEHCENGLMIKDFAVCRTCYWAASANYQHIALYPTRRLDIVWNGLETAVYDLIKQQAETENEPMPEFVKDILQRYLERIG